MQRERDTTEHQNHAERDLVHGGELFVDPVNDGHLGHRGGHQHRGGKVNGFVFADTKPVVQLVGCKNSRMGMKSSKVFIWA